MSVGPASAFPDHANATRLPSGDNAGAPFTPGYGAKGSRSVGATTGLPVRQASAPTITAATITAPTAIFARLRFATRSVCRGSAGTSGRTSYPGAVELAV